MNEWDFISRLLPIAPTLAILFFLWKAGLIRFRGENGNSVERKVDELTLHYNEEITTLLTNIDNKLDAQCRKLDKIVMLHEELKEYGVKTRV